MVSRLSDLLPKIKGKTIGRAFSLSDLRELWDA